MGWPNGEPRSPFSPEHREKLRRAKLGRKDTPEQTTRKAEIMRERFAAGWKSPGATRPRTGKQLAALAKNGTKGRVARGFRHTPETRQTIRDAHRGEKNHAWKGGVTPEHTRQRHSAAYREWRTAVFTRDDFTCKMPGCGTRGGMLNANHIKPFATHPNLRLAVNNGITLCVACHRSIRGLERGYEEMLTQAAQGVAHVA